MKLYNTKSERQDVLYFINRNIKSTHSHQIQIMKVKNLRFLNLKYGYDRCDKVLEILYYTILKSLAEISPLTEVFRMANHTFVTISPQHSLSELYAHSEVIYHDLDIALKNILPQSEKVRCNVVSMKIPQYYNSINESILAKLECYLHSGLNKDICYYDEFSLSKIIRQVEIKKRLKNALKDRKIKFYFQPQYNRYGEIVSVESLARWEDPILGIILPIEFIPEFEHSAIIHEFARYTISNTLDSLMRLRHRGFCDLSVSINLMRHNFEDDSLPIYIRDAAREREIPNEVVTLELTETFIPESDILIVDNLNKLRQFGFKLSLDDFGVGNASFSRLVLFDFDEIKLDRFFISSTNCQGIHGKISEITKLICDFCNNTGISIVVEGVETNEQKDIFFNNFNVNKAQGFYYSKALPFKQLVEVLIKNRLEKSNRAEG